MKTSLIYRVIQERDALLKMVRCYIQPHSEVQLKLYAQELLVAIDSATDLPGVNPVPEGGRVSGLYLPEISDSKLSIAPWCSHMDGHVVEFEKSGLAWFSDLGDMTVHPDDPPVAISHLGTGVSVDPDEELERQISRKGVMHG